MPSLQMSDLRATVMSEMSKPKGELRIMVFGCDNAANGEELRSEYVAVFSLPCIAMLPPTFIEYALREGYMDGVLLTGCRDGDCLHRMGVSWTVDRLAAEREPRLRSRVKRERIRESWASCSDLDLLAMELRSFRADLSKLPSIRQGT